ncbi:hypothetical protein GF406_02500 [candidate division KSB1 bacterium]|nr:hypothetical protein [candidate division KSB1 bacterium]
MIQTPRSQLISYIAPAAPATRKPATGRESFLRPEIGFTPRWFYEHLGIDFGEKWHTDPAYRLESRKKMVNELTNRFPFYTISRDHSWDVLTGTFGACTIAGIYGLDIHFEPDQWPACMPCDTGAELYDSPLPDLDQNPFFRDLEQQMDWITAKVGAIEGYINWQGVLNNAYRLRGEELLMDMATEPETVKSLFENVTMTMIKAAKRVYERQTRSGIKTRFFTVSNCFVNMVSPSQYRDLLLPFDQQIANTFELIGVHNCAWNATPYLQEYAKIPGVGYLDMGMNSDLQKAKSLFPQTRRAIMYTPMDVTRKSLFEIRQDLETIAQHYGPCDMVFADLDIGTEDRKIIQLVEICQQLSDKYAPLQN